MDFWKALGRRLVPDVWPRGHHIQLSTQGGQRTGLSTWELISTAPWKASCHRLGAQPHEGRQAQARDNGGHVSTLPSEKEIIIYNSLAPSLATLGQVFLSLQHNRLYGSYDHKVRSFPCETSETFTNTIRSVLTSYLSVPHTYRVTDLWLHAFLLLSIFISVRVNTYLILWRVQHVSSFQLRGQILGQSKGLPLQQAILHSQMYVFSPSAHTSVHTWVITCPLFYYYYFNFKCRLYLLREIERKKIGRASCRERV